MTRLYPIPLRCPSCGSLTDTHEGATPDDAPHDGAVFVCAYCASLAVFRDGPTGMYVTPPTEDEVPELAADRVLTAAVAAVQEALASGRPVSDAITSWRAKMRESNG